MIKKFWKNMFGAFVVLLIAGGIEFYCIWIFGPSAVRPQVILWLTVILIGIAMWANLVKKN